MHPKVTFVVPCYNLALYLGECVNSIVAQSFEDIEIIVLDDQSPDNTAEVSRKIIAANPGHRISYILNSENLGNIRNYNKGISIAQGEYVWILSPDDRLRNREIVGKYVRLMEANPEVGYIFCPGHMIEGDQERGVYQRSLYGNQDQILDSIQLVKDIVDNCFELLSPSVMIRKKCYDEITFFPEDMPHRGDSYVWALISMHNKVGYFAEPMVDYRIHDNSMMSTLARENLAGIVGDNVKVLWKIKAEAEKRSFFQIAEYCRNALVRNYALAMSGIRCRGHSFRLQLEEFENSLMKFEADPAARTMFRCHVYHAYGDFLYWDNRFSESEVMYRRSGEICCLGTIPTKLKSWVKLALLKCGRVGAFLRNCLGKVHQLSGAGY